jgi:hypothetical protein
LNGLRIAATTRLAQAHFEQSDTARAFDLIEQAAADLEQFDPNNFYRAEVWWTHHQILSLQDQPRANAVLQRALDWLESTAEHVPLEHRSSFFEHNPINRAIMSAARTS